MLLAPIIAQAKTALNLDFDAHICPTRLQMASTFFQIQVIVIWILASNYEPFGHYATSPKLEHKPHRPTPLTKTETFPLRVTTINEATVVLYKLGFTPRSTGFDC